MIGDEIILDLYHLRFNVTNINMTSQIQCCQMKMKTEYPMYPCIQPVNTKNGGSILTLLWINQAGFRVGAYANKGNVPFLSCKDEGSIPALALRLDIGPSFQTVKELHVVIDELYNHKNHLSNEERNLLESCKVWLEMLMDHWWKNGFHIDWLTNTHCR